MTPRRSYYWVGIPYAVMGIAMLVWTYLRAEWSIQLLALVPVLVAASVLDHWSNFVAPKLAWSRGAILFLTALILAPDTTAPLVGVAIGAAAGFTDVERLNLKPGRLLLNAGMLAVAWGTAGLAYEALGEQAPGPSLDFLSAAALAYAAQLSINTGLAALAVGTVFGGAAAVAVPASLLVMAPLTFLLSMAVAGVASVVSLAGPSFMPIAVISGAVVLAIPVIHARVAAVRRDVSAAVARAALVDGRLHSAEDHARLLNLTIRVGWRLGLAAEQLEQLVYLTTLFVVTDLYAAYLPRSVEQELAGAAQRSSSWTLIAGLATEDLAQREIVLAAEAVCIFDGLLSPNDGSTPLTPRDAIDELRELGVGEPVLAALLDRTPLARSYVRIMEMNPESMLRKPLRWLTFHHRDHKCWRCIRTRRSDDVTSGSKS